MTDLESKLREVFGHEDFREGQREVMEALLAGQLPARVETLFAETLQGDHPAYRYAGLALVAELVRRHGGTAARHAGALIVDDEEVFFYRGNLAVSGDLVLGDRAVVVVAGDLKVKGSFVGGASDYSLLAVGGAMKAANVMTLGELIVGKRLDVAGAAYLYRNDYSAMAPVVRAAVLIQNERFDRFREVIAGDRVAELIGEYNPDRLQYVCGLLGLEPVPDADQLEAALRRRLTAAVPR